MKLYLACSAFWTVGAVVWFIWEDIHRLFFPEQYTDDDLGYNYRSHWSYWYLLTTLPFINVVHLEIILVDLISDLINPEKKEEK